MRHIQYVNDKPIVLLYHDFDDVLDINELTKIDYSNLYAESITVSSLLSRVIQLMAEAEKAYEDAKLECIIEENKLEKHWRRDALRSSENTFKIKEEGLTPYSIKLTDKSVSAAILSDKKRVDKKRAEINAKRDWGYLKGIVEGVKSKSKKLDLLLPKVTPEEFWNELVDGSICNLIEIRKPKK